MLTLAKTHQTKAMGFIGGILGPSSFVRGKATIATKLRQSSIRTEVVAPTIVYGDDRNDAMSKFVPLLKFFGLFSKKFKPVHVDDVTEELLHKLVIS